MSNDAAALFSDLIREQFGAATRLDDVLPLAGDASTRRYARLILSGPSAPASVVAMILADRGVAMSSEELAVLEEEPDELPYVNVHRFLAAVGVDIPELYADACDRGVLLLEDIGDTALWDAVQEQPKERVVALYEAAIEQLLLIQLRGTQNATPECIAFQQNFDRRLFEWEFEHFIEHGIERRLGRPLPANEAACLREHFTAMAQQLGNEPRHLNHRDYHSWNLFVQGDRIRVIDFQDALLAPLPYDLATLLGDRDTPLVVRPDIEEGLLDYYCRRWQEQGGGALDGARFAQTYALCALQKALKVVGRFYFLANVKKKPAYLRYIPSTVRQIQRLLPRFREHADLADLLRRHLPGANECAP